MDEGAPGVVSGLALFDRATALLCPCGGDVMVFRQATPIPDGRHGRGGIERQCPRCRLIITIEAEV